jgi:hypothetical protein
LIERRWTNTAGELHKGHLGAPRAWVGAATGQSGSTHIILNNDLAPMQLNVAAEWNRSTCGSNYPCIDIPYNAIYKLTPTTIGACWQVPDDMITVVQTIIEHSNPMAVWYESAAQAIPAMSFAAAWPNGPTGRVDHAILYRFFDQGFTYQQIARATNTQVGSIKYVYGKWKSGISPTYRHKTTRSLDKEAMLDDIKAGIAVSIIGLKYGCAAVTVSKLARLHNFGNRHIGRPKRSATTTE